MNYQFWIVIGIMAAAAVLGYFFWYRPKQKRKATEAQQGCPPTHAPTSHVCLPREFAYQIDRPDGGYCAVEHGARPSEAILEQINSRIISGLNRMIAASLRDFPHWTNAINSSAHTVIFIRKTATNQDGTPALMVGQYQSAGTIANIKPDGSTRGVQYLILPQPDDWNNVPANYWDYLEASAYNEGEHAIEYNNDFAVFRQYVGGNDVHPHRQPVQPVGLVRVAEYARVIDAACKGVTPTDNTVRLSGTRLIKA